MCFESKNAKATVTIQSYDPPSHSFSPNYRKLFAHNRLTTGSRSHKTIGRLSFIMNVGSKSIFSNFKVININKLT